MKSLGWEGIAGAGCCILLAGLAFSWQRTVSQHQKIPRITEPWEHIQKEFPIPDSFKEASEVSESLLQAVLHANPFSMERQPPPPTTIGDQAAATPPPPPPPQFVYKGRVLMGAKQRAIIQETQSKKTYFLQVGQEIVGFTVREISESQVVLFDPSASKEVVIPLSSNASSSSQ
ncbi:MAG: hypothetical protein HYZ89_06240 [Candidatus Omnitrophica bacterium]|nr:hypothetical protein [Candidatus Omnitrophota bacterium]